MKSTSLFAVLLALTACGGNSGSESTPAPQSDPVVADSNNNPEEIQDDPITITDPDTPADPVQEPTTPTEPEAVQEPEEPAEEQVQEPEDPPEDPVQEPVVENEDPPEQPVQNPPETTEPETPEQEQTNPEPDTPAQPIMDDPVTNTGGCTVPPAGTTVVSKTTPVHPNDNPFYYPIMGPQCVSPPSQFDGPGLRYGDFLLRNNAWNGQQSSWDWQQCINITEASDGSILPSWNFDWGNEDDLQPGLFEWEVKSFPEIIFGYKSNDEISAPCESTGLPSTVSTLPELSIAYTYNAPVTNNRIGDRGDEANNPPTVTGGDRNIAIESFFHSSCDIQRGNASNMELELMVWLEVGNERLPSGSPPVAQFTSSTGHTYDVYTKSDNYVAYVAQNTVRSDTLNYSEFIDDTIGNVTTYGVKTLQNDWCMANVIFGSEIWWGEGSVNLDYYQITRQY